MPPRTLLLLRPSTIRIVPRPMRHHPALLKFYSTTPPPPHTPPNTPTENPDVLPSAGEEAAASAQVIGETVPVVEEQGTPIGELVDHSPEASQNAPSVLTDSPSEEGSTTAAIPAPPPLPPGAKFQLPELPIPARAHLKYRYSPLVEQVTNFLMRHGKKATAQSNVIKILSILRTKPAPKPNAVSSTPLIPGTPALSSLPADPIAYLQTAIDSVAPLMKLTSVKGSGGSKDIIPSPLSLRQRRRAALEWITEAADKRSDRNPLPERFADEIVAVVEGRSTAWDRRTSVHRQAIVARANVSTQPRRRGKNTMKFPYN